MLKINLANDEGSLVKFFEHKESVFKSYYHLAVADIGSIYTKFKSVSGTTAATTAISTPTIDGSIEVHNILLSAEKKNLASIELRFTDATNTISIFKAILTDAPVAIASHGHWAGWKNARLEVVTTLDFVYSITAGYHKVLDGLNYSAWDALR